MKYSFRCALFIVIASIYTLASVEIVHSIDQISFEIHSVGGISNFTKVMNGDTLPNEFSSDFWSIQTALKPSDIINIIAPQYKNDKWSLVGMKAWPGQKDRYIVVACSTKIKKDILDKDQQNSCSYEVDPRDKIVVAVLDYDGSGMPTLAAEPYIETVIRDEYGRVGGDENGDALEKSAFSLKNDNNEMVVAQLQRLDFAHYQLNPQILAFGIRYGAHVGYSENGVFNQSITLFAIMQGKLRPVFKTNMYYFADNKGEWHDDGTGGHNIIEKEYVLSLLPNQTNGFYDIKHTQKGVKDNKSKIYRWSNHNLQYQ
ncbi:unnamed protein product [Commensalibacter communis]|uniref:hypothetical protein n=1 Tax=Commensalibacter communis TaxID=2972786 RepID=UPI0022FF6137|nr:hypothetical protein [Commensalibacter communis]CAI3928348.1 unnamed protein product [Commensalibacter communis]